MNRRRERCALFQPLEKSFARHDLLFLLEFHIGHNTRGEKEKRLEEEVWICAWGRGGYVLFKKKKKRRRAALSAVFIQIGGFCFRPCSRLDIHQWKFLSRLIIPGDPVRQAQFSKEFPPSLATARYFIRNCFLLPDVCRPPSTKLLPRSQKVDPFPGWSLSTTTFSNGWNSNF